MVVSSLQAALMRIEHGHTYAVFNRSRDLSDVFSDVVSFVEDGEMKTQYPIIIGGENFGCGSSREHAPVALGAAGKSSDPLIQSGAADAQLHSLKSSSRCAAFQLLRLLLTAVLCYAGAVAVVAQSYARIFFRNSMAT